VINGEIRYEGKVGTSISLSDVSRAIEICVLNSVAIAKQALDGDLDRITGIPRLRVYVNSVDTFSEHATIANSASQLLLDIFGELGNHSRSAIGVASLPLNSPVEIELLFAVK
jgi:enamine deaminase RidA (YjgF/YER057c/UK114 family)